MCIRCVGRTLRDHSRGIKRYRVFSDSGQANGKRYLYAGTGEPWGWVMDRFVNRDNLEILQASFLSLRSNFLAKIYLNQP